MPYVRTTRQFTVTGNEEIQQYASLPVPFYHQSQAFLLMLTDNYVEEKGCQLEAMSQYHTSDLISIFQIWSVCFLTMSDQCEGLSRSSISLMIFKIQVPAPHLRKLIIKNIIICLWF